MKHVSGYTNSARFRALEDLQKDSADLCLSYCGWEYCDPGHRYGPNMRTTYVLHIIRSGRGTLEIHNQKYVLTAGDAFLLSPNMEAWYEADRGSLVLYVGWNYRVSCEGICGTCRIYQKSTDPQGELRERTEYLY